MACNGFKVDYIIIAFWRVSSYLCYRLCDILDSLACVKDPALSTVMQTAHDILTNLSDVLYVCAFLFGKKEQQPSVNTASAELLSVVMLLYAFVDIALFWHYCWYEQYIIWFIFSDRFIRALSLLCNRSSPLLELSCNALVSFIAISPSQQN